MRSTGSPDIVVNCSGAKRSDSLPSEPSTVFCSQLFLAAAIFCCSGLACPVRSLRPAPLRYCTPLLPLLAALSVGLETVSTILRSLLCEWDIPRLIQVYYTRLIPHPLVWQPYPLPRHHYCPASVAV